MDLDSEVESVNETKATTAKKDRKATTEEEEYAPLTAKDILAEIFSTLVYLVVCFIVVVLLTQFVGQRIVVSGSSMETTLSDGDNLIVDKISYRFNKPERFDIVVFPYQYEDDTYYIKRIIALPGETVYIDADGKIYINGTVLEENYGAEVIANQGLAAETIILGNDEYFVLGDNRNNSTDSRFEAVGNIKGKDIEGRAWFRVYPFDEAGFVENMK
ncbi:MAG: signal peptidase I [Pseudobutyrivibrio sp.]|nr:signal peptidase I [Pseudobutyrivibrio sp.]